MPELRWTLLLIGALFVGVLAWWERRKPRQSPRGGHEPTMSEAPAPRILREPTLTLPEMRARDPAPPHDLPVLEIAEDESLIGLRIDGQRVEEEVAREEAAARSIPEPIMPSPPVLAAAPSAQTLPDVSLPKLREPVEPIVDWPPEEERQIIALRLVSVSPERFSGRAIRTALVAEGFVLGRFSIFHKPDAEHRAVLSAASLSKPGVFDLDTIDTQRFSGLNLFAILPGPKPPREAFEDLLACARNLNERLQGGLQDERGGPLTPTRIALLRESMGGASTRESDATP
jgi:cell division protein ZipA